jgi:hypothetical protein
MSQLCAPFLCLPYKEGNPWLPTSLATFGIGGLHESDIALVIFPKTRASISQSHVPSYPLALPVGIPFSLLSQVRQNT